MMPSERTAVTGTRATTWRSPSWLPPFLFVLAIVAELLSLVLMTIYRYRNQGLEPVLTDLSKTANMLGFLVAFPFLLLFLALALMPRHHRASLATTAVAMSSTGLVILTIIPLVAPADRNYACAGYLIFKVIEFATFTIVLGKTGRPWWRNTVGVILLAIALMGGIFFLVIATVLLSPIGLSVDESPPKEYDAAVILGAAVWSRNKPSPVLRERLNTGYDLLKNGTVQFVVLTGGNAPNELPEAEVGRRELLKRGADPTRIVVERHTGSTSEQILYIRDQLIKTQRWSSFIIVSDQFHLTRALEICRFNEIDASGVSSESPLGPQNLVVYHLRESVALILYWMFGI